ncbi:unnamed protein product, partial [Didymodactylos carnosus]
TARYIIVFDQIGAVSSAPDLFGKNAVQLPSPKKLPTKKDTKDETIGQSVNGKGFVDSDKSWTPQAIDAIFTLCDRIVTHWKSRYLRVQTTVSLHSVLCGADKILTKVPLLFADRGVRFDVKEGFDKYQNIFTPLYDRELWHEFVISHIEMLHLQKNVKVEFEINSSNSRIFFGEILMDYADNYNSQDRLFSPYDVILMTINNDNYFGVVVYARHTRVKEDNQETNKCRTIQVHTLIGIYVSEKCSVQHRKRRTLNPVVEISRFKSLTPTKRCLTAINNLPFSNQDVCWLLH